MTKEERQAALTEVRVLSMLSHPNIIEYYENFLEDKALMIVMEYAQGYLIHFMFLFQLVLLEVVLVLSMYSIVIHIALVSFNTIPCVHVYVNNIDKADSK